MSRPFGSKNRKTRRKHPKPPKIPMVGGKALPGRPRKDLRPPIQRAVLLTPEDRAILEDKRLLIRIGYLAGVEGLPPKFIAVKIRDEYPKVNAQTADFEPNGRFFEAALLGVAKAVGEVGANLHERATTVTGKGFEALFVMKCRAEWAETSAGRAKIAVNSDDEDRGLDIEFDEEPDHDASAPPKRPRRKKETADEEATRLDEEASEAEALQGDQGGPRRGEEPRSIRTATSVASQAPQSTHGVFARGSKEPQRVRKAASGDEDP